MAPKFATPGSDPAENQVYSLSAHGIGAVCTFTWRNPHALHGPVTATKWIIWIGQDMGGGEKYRTQTPILDGGGVFISDINVPKAALPLGPLWVTPKYQKPDLTWNDGASTKFTVVP